MLQRWMRGILLMDVYFSRKSAQVHNHSGQLCKGYA